MKCAGSGASPTSADSTGFRSPTTFRRRHRRVATGTASNPSRRCPRRRWRRLECASAASSSASGTGTRVSWRRRSAPSTTSRAGAPIAESARGGTRSSSPPTASRFRPSRCARISSRNTRRPCDSCSIVVAPTSTARISGSSMRRTTRSRSKHDSRSGSEARERNEHYGRRRDSPTAGTRRISRRPNGSARARCWMRGVPKSAAIRRRSCARSTSAFTWAPMRAERSVMRRSTKNTGQRTRGA